MIAKSGFGLLALFSLLGLLFGDDRRRNPGLFHLADDRWID